jgi:hypothetical protein
LESGSLNREAANRQPPDRQSPDGERAYCDSADRRGTDCDATETGAP